MTSGLGAGQATRSAAELYQRFRQLIHEGAKFLIVGGIGFVIVIAGSDALRFDLGLGKFTSVTIATIVATVITFLGNRYWSFRHRQGAGARSETVLFFIFNGVGLLIQYACIYLVTDMLGLPGRLWYTIANFVGVGIGTLFRFWSYRKWIWVQPEVHLARLRRGRHRKGRTTSAPPAQLHQSIPVLQPVRPQAAGPEAVSPPIPLARRPVRQPSIGQSHLSQPPFSQPQPGPHGGPHPLARPMLAATHTPVPPAEDPNRWSP